jgi:hypothetical protein
MAETGWRQLRYSAQHRSGDISQMMRAVEDVVKGRGVAAAGDANRRTR